jgi:hypothetical protein
MDRMIAEAVALAEHVGCPVHAASCVWLRASEKQRALFSAGARQRMGPYSHLIDALDDDEVLFRLAVLWEKR